MTIRMAKRALKLCREKDCKNLQTTMGFCRLHYIKNWKKIKDKQQKKAANSLNKYVEHIMKRHPENYVETIKHDLRHSGRFQRKAEEFFGDEEFHDALDEIDMGREVDRILDSIKVDESY